MALNKNKSKDEQVKVLITGKHPILKRNIFRPEWIDINDNYHLKSLKLSQIIRLESLRGNLSAAFDSASILGSYVLDLEEELVKQGGTITTQGTQITLDWSPKKEENNEQE